MVEGSTSATDTSLMRPLKIVSVCEQGAQGGYIIPDESFKRNLDDLAATVSDPPWIRVDQANSMSNVTERCVGGAWKQVDELTGEPDR